MKPFQIQCLTCSTPLKVTKPEAIGLILACPKCNGMVQVVAPEGWSLEEETSISTQPPGAVSSEQIPPQAAATTSAQASSRKNNEQSKSGNSKNIDRKNDDSKINNSKISDPKTADKKNSTPKTPASKKQSPEIVAATALGTLSTSASTNPPASTHAAPIGALSAITSPAASSTASPKIASKKPKVKKAPSNPLTSADPTLTEATSWLVPVVGAAAVFVTIGISWWLLSQLQENPKLEPIVIAQTTENTASGNTGASGNNTLDQNSVDYRNATSSSQKPIDGDTTSNNNLPNATSDPQQAPANPNDTANPPTNVSEVNPPNQNLAVGDQPPAATNPNDPQAKPVANNNNSPPDTNLGNGNLGHGKLVLQPVPEQAVGNAQPFATPDSKALPISPTDKKDPTANKQENNKVDNQVASIEPKLSAVPDANKIVEPVDISQLERVPYLAVDSAVLEMTLAGVSYDKVPLYRVLDDISDLVHTPIHYDTKALEQNGVSVVMPVRLKAGNITVRSLLERVLEPFGLTLVEQPHYLVVSQFDHQATPTRSRYVVEDLGRDKQLLQSEVLSPIQRLVASESWATAQVEIQDTTLIIDQTFDVHDQIVTWLEKLRTARGLPLQTKYDPAQASLRRFNPARFQVASDWTVAKPALMKKVTAGFPRPEVMSVILRHLQQQSGVAIVLDHAALDQIELSPASTAILSVRDVPLQEALEKILAPLGLSFAPIDSQTIVISTPLELNSKKSLEWYPLQGLMAKNIMPTDSEKIIPWLNDQLKKSSSSFEITAADFHWDQASRTLVVRGSPLMHRDLTHVLEL